MEQFEEAQWFDCVLSAPRPPVVGWRKQWNADANKVIYSFDPVLYTQRHPTTGETTGPESTLPPTVDTAAHVLVTHAIFIAPEPGPSWVKTWSQLFQCVMYENASTGVIVDSIEKVRTHCYRMVRCMHSPRR